MKSYLIEVWKFRDYERLPEFVSVELEATSPEQLETRLRRMKDYLILSGCENVEYKII